MEEFGKRKCDDRQLNPEDKPVFTCSLCEFSCRFDYFGNKPSFAKSIVLLEDAYIIQDPFSPSKSHLTIGGHCSSCNSCICVGQKCSLFYTKRFCIPCVQKQVEEFPLEIRKEIQKKGDSSS